MQPEPKFKEGERVKYAINPRGVRYGTVIHAHPPTQPWHGSAIYSVKQDGVPDREFVYEHEMEKLDA